MQRPPAFQFHIHDYRGSRSVQRMTYAQRGMYVEMLCEQWDKGSIPDCPRACADILGGTIEEWEANWPALRRNFVDRRNRPRAPHENPIPTDHNAARQIINLRLEKYRRSLRKWRGVLSDAGKKGGRAKAQKGKENGAGLATANPSQAVAKPDHSFVSQAVSQSVSQIQTQRPAASIADARSKRPVYTSDRFAVFEWQLDDLSKMLGSHYESFDLHAFFDALSQQSRTSGLVIPRSEVWDWLQAQVLSEAQRRKLPIASASAVPAIDRKARERAQDERILADIQQERIARAGR
jgi:hypothetical protein